MKKTLLPVAAMLAATPIMWAADDEQSRTLPETNAEVPQSAIVLTGGENGVHEALLQELYNDSNHTFNDPDAPRFLLIDKKGNTVFGIGGQIEGVARYDFGGEIDANTFLIRDIPVPADPARRSGFGADATRSSLVFHLLRNTKLGVLSAYIHADFSGNNYGFKLRQAYVRLHNVTAGLAISTFQDVMATPSTIDYDGPVGKIDRKNMMLQYKVNYGNGFGWGVAAELPPVGITYGKDAEHISQRVPDIPAYVQYQWAGGKSHVRASAILRNLSYRDLESASNKIQTGYGVQLSSVIKLAPQVSVIGQATYGRGIASYMEGTMTADYDLVPSSDPGKLKATPSFGFVGGVKIKPCKKFFMTSSYSMLRLYDTESVGSDAFRRGNYAVVNAFYNPLDELQIGIEYLHGRYKEVNGLSGTANRIECMVKYSF